MPIYSFKFVIPKNTPKDNPFIQKFKVKKYVLKKVIVRIPPGHAGLTGLQIWYGNEQLIPKNEGSWITGSNEWIEWDEYYVLFEQPQELTFKGYNEDEENDHYFLVYFNVIPIEIFLYGVLGEKIAETTRKLLE